MILVNGRQQAQISIHDRGLQYGDGVFETIAVYKGKALAWERHLQRLQRGCEGLHIPCPAASLLRQEASALIAEEELAVLKLILTRGEGGRGYAAPQNPQVTRIFSLHAWPRYAQEYQEKGIEAGVCHLRMGSNPALAGIKHLNRLEQVLIKQELTTRGLVEGLVLDNEGCLLEGCMSNVFLVRDHTLFTPDLSHAGVEGVMRAAILELAATIQLECKVETLRLEDAFAAEEIFFCNSIIGIWPVKELDGQCFNEPVVGRQLQTLLHSKELIVRA